MTPKVEVKTALAVFQEVADLQEALDVMKEAAINDLLVKRAEIDQHLAALGFDGTVKAPAAPKVRTSTEVPASTRQKTKGKKTKKGKRTSKPREERYCPICMDFGHDGRAHKSQGVKKAFTKAELAAMAA